MLQVVRRWLVADDDGDDGLTGCVWGGTKVIGMEAQSNMTTRTLMY